MHSENKRLSILFGFFSVVIFGIIVKLLFIQIFAADLNSSSQYLKTRKIPPARGEIFDRNNESLAINQTTYQLFAEPKNVSDKDLLIQKLDSVIAVGEATLSARLDMSKTWVPLASNLPQDKKDAVDKLHLKGVGFDPQRKRFYPESSLSAHLSGFVGKTNNGEDKGYFGLEGYYDKDLTGIPGILNTERDLQGNPIFVGVQELVQGADGRDLTLTIDKNVQRIAKTRLKDGINKYGAKNGCIIIANPQTLEIIALTCLPDYDPNQYYLYDQAVFNNQAVSTLYEPGSIFKPIIMASAMNEGVIHPDTTMDETGPLTMGGYQIQTWNNKYEGKITMTRILEKSSNVGMVFVGDKLGKQKELDYIKKFGFGAQTGIDLEGEETAYLKKQSDWYPIDYATATFGQGIAVTPIQMIRAFSAVINGGKLMTPYIVSSIKSADGHVHVIKPHVDRQVISAHTSELIRSMLESTVVHGEIKVDLPQGYRVGGKTGTAQIPIAGHYDSSKTVASFMGFAPVDNPKFLVLVMFKEPSASIYGAETAEPVFFNVAKDLFVYYNMSAQ